MLIAAAIEVHRDKGPDRLESIYEWRLARDLRQLRRPPKARHYLAQGLHPRRTTPFRFTRRRLRADRSQVRPTHLPIHKA